MKGIITFTKDGVDGITRFSFCLSKSESDVYHTMHEHDIWSQVGEYIKTNIKETDSVVTIGYKMSVMPKFKSRLDNVKIRYGKEWENILSRSIKNKR